MEVDLNLQEMEYTPTIILNGSCPQYFTNGRSPHLFENGKKTSNFRIFKTNLILNAMEDNFNIFPNGRQPKLFY